MKREPTRPSVSGAPSWQQTLQQGLTLHRSGRLAEARAAYEQVLRANPRQADALHLLGLLFADTGDPGRALPLLRSALRESPRSAPIAAALSRALVAAGQAGEAATILGSALAKEPRNAELLLHLALALHQGSDPQRAVDAYRALLDVDPKQSVGWFNLGTLLRRLGPADEARTAFERALELNPSFAAAAVNLGCVLQDQGRHDDAIVSLDKALALEPKNVEALIALSNSLRELGRHAEAIDAAERALAASPGRLEGRTALAAALVAAGRDEEGEQAYRTALAEQPTSVEVLNNFGNLLLKRGKLTESRELLRRALELQPGRAEVSLNLGMTLHQLGELDEAETCYRRALAQSPGLHAAGLNLAMARLARGDFSAGWDLYEHRWNTDLRNVVRTFPQPAWDGRSDLRGKTLLLHAEQGLGDTIQFARFAPMLAATGARIVLEVQPPLVGLLASLEGDIRVVPRGTALPPFDVHCPLLSVPRLLGFDPTRVTPPPAYLRAPADALAKWKPEFADLPHPRVGWVWSGNPRHKNDHNRSLPYAIVRSLAADFPGGHVSLQVDYREGEREALAHDGVIRDLSGRVSDFSDTAAVASLLDLVICVDTSAAHLAGALGRPVWILLPFCADWRWMLAGSSSCWYPSARLFRQTAHGDWAGVAANVRSALQSLSR